MKLAVFDLDGTLTQTNAVDDICFILAFADAGIDDLNDDWSEYQNITDSGVTHEAFLNRMGRTPTAEEVLRIVDRFVELLREHYASDAGRFRQTPGAASFLLNLQKSSQWRVAIATGCWSRSAQFKIEAAGLPINGCPAGFAEDGRSREAIVQAAIRRAADRYAENGFEKIVSIGDAVWDIRTAHRLQLPFVGIGDGEGAETLRRQGASHVVPDFVDEARCIRALDEAAIPDWLGQAASA
jgi:phosphoglycolate phosphatase-like HAD superfamily hydrolase